MDTDENKLIRKSTGQLNWLASQTRPDLAYDALSLSVCLNKANYKNAKYSKKIVQRAKEEKFQIKFSQLGDIKDLKLQVYADASLGNIELNSETKSVMGSFICLSNNEGNMSPLTWKSKVIDKVATDIKSAETLALEAAIDDSIHLSSMISELYSGNVEKKVTNFSERGFKRTC